MYKINTLGIYKYINFVLFTFLKNNIMITLLNFKINLLGIKIKNKYKYK